MALGSGGRRRKDKEFCNSNFTFQRRAGVGASIGPDLAGASLWRTGSSPTASVLWAWSRQRAQPHDSWRSRLPTVCPKATFPRVGGSSRHCCMCVAPTSPSVHTASQHSLPDARGGSVTQLALCKPARGSHTARDSALSQTTPGLILGAVIRESAVVSMLLR